MAELQLKEVNKKQKDFEEIKSLYNEAFPKEEIIPLWLLLYKAKQNDTDFLAIYDKEKLIGITYICYGKEDIAFILYLAINNKFRGNGYGSKALDLIKERCNGKRLILNIEKLDNNAQNSEQRVKRKRFYEKNGFNDLNYITNDGGVEYEMMGYGKYVSKEEYNNLMKNYLGRFIYFIMNLFYKN